MTRPAAVVGIFVGGRGTRLGGRAKGLLVTPEGETILARLLRVVADLGLPAVLVGRHPAYADVGIDVLEDDPRATGPLAGLVALLTHAGDRTAIALACDMPRVSAAPLRSLLEAPPAPVVAPRSETPRGPKWDAMFARYDAKRVLPIALEVAARGERSLQSVLEAAGAAELVLSAEERAALQDWDTPEDLHPDVARGTREEG